MSCRRSGVILGSLLLLGSACLFSTTPPERQDPVTQPTDPTVVTVTGLVQLFDLTDHHLRSTPNWPVRVDWYVADRNGDGQPDMVLTTEVRSTAAGVYEAAYSSSSVVRTDVRAAVCNYQVAETGCCFDDPPCDPVVCRSIWGTTRTLQVSSGQRYQQNLVVPCQNVP